MVFVDDYNSLTDIQNSPCFHRNIPSSPTNKQQEKWHYRTIVNMLDKEFPLKARTITSIFWLTINRVEEFFSVVSRSSSLSAQWSVLTEKSYKHCNLANRVYLEESCAGKCEYAHEAHENSTFHFFL